MLDVLSYLAYNTTPIDRQRRADILREDYENKISEQQKAFVNFVLEMYVRNGFKELGMEKLPILLNMKYHSISDAKSQLNMDATQLREFFIDMQHELYNGAGVNRMASA